MIDFLTRIRRNLINAVKLRFRKRKTKRDDDDDDDPYGFSAFNYPLF